MVETSAPPKICVVAVSPMTVQVFLMPHLERLSRNYDVTIVTNSSRPIAEFARTSGVTFVQLSFERKPSILLDLCSIVGLMRILSKSKFSAIVSVNPKAGLLAAIAGFLSNVKVRVHWFTGQVWVGSGRIFRFFMKSLDRLVVFLCTSALADSRAQQTFLVEQGIARRGEIEVLCEGSISGVDCARFAPNYATRLSKRENLGLDKDVFVTVFLGRLTRDKGVFELAEAFSRMVSARESLLMFVGPDEDHVAAGLRRTLESASKRFVFVGGTDRPEDYLAAGDLMCLPSHREGFGSSVIEASATGLPVLVSDIYGLRDCFLDSVTGYDFPVGDIAALATKLDWFSHNPVQSKIMGENGREFVRAHFDQLQVVNAFEGFLSERIRQATSR